MGWAEKAGLACMTLPLQHRTRLHATTPTEDLKGEMKRRTDVVGIFPKVALIRHLVGAILIEQTEPWTVQRGRYMTLETLAPVCGDLTVSACTAQRRIRSACQKPQARDKRHQHMRHHPVNVRSSVKVYS